MSRDLTVMEWFVLGVMFYKSILCGLLALVIFFFLLSGCSTRCYEGAPVESVKAKKVYVHETVYKGWGPDNVKVTRVKK